MERANEKEVELKEITLSTHAALYQFNPLSLGQLKDPVAFASASFITKLTGTDALAAGMLLHSRKPLPTSLSRLPDPKQSKQACAVFKNVLGYMGDKQYQQPETLACEILTAGVEATNADGNDSVSVPLRLEIYCQIMKQLSSNPDPASEKKGWLLLMLCLCTFPPGPSLEYHLQVFIRDRIGSSTSDEARKQSLIAQCE